MGALVSSSPVVSPAARGEESFPCCTIGSLLEALLRELLHEQEFHFPNLGPMEEETAKKAKMAWPRQVAAAPGPPVSLPLEPTDQDFPLSNLGPMQEEEEAIRKRKIVWEPQAGRSSPSRGVWDGRGQERLDTGADGHRHRSHGSHSGWTLVQKDPSWPLACWFLQSEYSGKTSV
ncbi:uncharacterized protein LOC144247295 isoform X2 [Lonchura striata]